MSDFPRTTVDGVSVPRLICGTNWILGYSHISHAKDRLIRDVFDKPSKAADVFEVFARNGCNAVMSPLTDFIYQALQETQQRTGVRMIWICTPGYAVENVDEWKRAVEDAKSKDATFCFPHTCVTDQLLDRVNKRLAPQLTDNLKVVREMGMIPGLSTHEPEAILFADATNADVASYVQPYNATGFLCRYETDWMQRMINNASKPVMVIKPLAAGSLRPPTGLSFVWNTIRERDMVTVGIMSPYEAEECLEISRACLEKRMANVELQVTRSKSPLLSG